MAERARKFCKGEPFANVAALAEWLDRGGWCYWLDRPKHPLVIGNMVLSVISHRSAPRAPAAPSRSRSAVTLFVDFDDTDCRLRLWIGSRLVGELAPDILATPKGERADTRWTGWISSNAVVEVFGVYKQVVPEPSDG